jgi:hypothetical protein
MKTEGLKFPGTIVCYIQIKLLPKQGLFRGLQQVDTRFVQINDLSSQRENEISDRSQVKKFCIPPARFLHLQASFPKLPVSDFQRQALGFQPLPQSLSLFFFSRSYRSFRNSVFDFAGLHRHCSYAAHSDTGACVPERRWGCRWLTSRRSESSSQLGMLRVRVDALADLLPIFSLPAQACRLARESHPRWKSKGWLACP